MKRLFKCATFAIFASLLFFSCATTKITETWKDDGYRGAPFSDLFVIGVAKEEKTRRSFENKFVEKLQAAGNTGCCEFVSYGVRSKDRKNGHTSCN